MSNVRKGGEMIDVLNLFIFILVDIHTVELIIVSSKEDLDPSSSKRRQIESALSLNLLQSSYILLRVSIIGDDEKIPGVVSPKRLAAILATISQNPKQLIAHWGRR